MECNIDQKDRTNRVVIGAILLIAALLNVGKGVMMLLAIILIVEGVIGWCGIPLLLEKAKALFNKKV